MKPVLSNLILILSSLIYPTLSQAQTLLKGQVTDIKNRPLPKVNVSILNTEIITATDADGTFSLKTIEDKGILNISLTGMEDKNIFFSVYPEQTQDLGIITLNPSKVDQLEEVVFTGAKALSLSKERQTPVAISTLKEKEIKDKVGNLEFPEILRGAPSTYVTKGGGGFGDSKMSLRGFSDYNLALMVNGQPVNDMENGKVYWSSWSGLQDIATAVQVQRGLGASRLAVSSVGGGINIITKATDRKKGGFAQFGTGNDNHYKLSAFYSTGLDKNGWGASLLLTQRQGEGYIIGTPFNAYNYFFSLGYKPDTRHTFNLVFTGVSEWHGKRSRTIAIEDYLKYNHDRLNIRHNANWGYRNGQEFNWINNYYNKPIAQLNWNWNWKINRKLFLTSIVYASWGWGGGSNVNGKINGKDAYRLPAAEDGSQRIDDIEKWNKGGSVPDFGLSKGKWPGVTHNGEYITTKSEGIYQVAGINKHSWYGFISNLGAVVTR